MRTTSLNNLWFCWQQKWIIREEKNKKKVKKKASQWWIGPAITLIFALSNRMVDFHLCPAAINHNQTKQTFLTNQTSSNRNPTERTEVGQQSTNWTQLCVIIYDEIHSRKWSAQLIIQRKGNWEQYWPIFWIRYQNLTKKKSKWHSFWKIDKDPPKFSCDLEERDHVVST